MHLSNSTTFFLLSTCTKVRTDNPIHWRRTPKKNEIRKMMKSDWSHKPATYDSAQRMPQPTISSLKTNSH